MTEFTNMVIITVVLCLLMAVATRTVKAMLGLKLPIKNDALRETLTLMVMLEALLIEFGVVLILAGKATILDMLQVNVIVMMIAVMMQFVIVQGEQ